MRARGRGKHHRRQGIEAAEAAQPPRLSVGRGLGQGLDLAIQLPEPGERLLESEERHLERARPRGDLEALAAEPRPMRPGPVPAGEIAPPVSIEDLHDAVRPPEHVPAHVLATAAEVADGFFRFRWHVDGRELARPEQSDPRPGITLVRLDPLPRAPRRQPRRDDLARHPEASDLAIPVVVPRLPDNDDSDEPRDED